MYVWVHVIIFGDDVLIELSFSVYRMDPGIFRYPHIQ